MEVVLAIVVLAGAAWFIKEKHPELYNQLMASLNKPKAETESSDTTTFRHPGIKPTLGKVVVGESKPSATGEQIPEDSTLRRHYLQAKQAAEQQAAPVAVVVETAQVTEAPQAVEAVEAVEVAEVAEVVPAAVEVAEPVVVAESKPAQKSAIPEDSALRRHYLSQLSAEVAASLPAKPSDSSLKRHYEQLLAAKLADALK
jgi:uncharacterized protein YnzC (UPF0291/DUF896 family)